MGDRALHLLARWLLRVRPPLEAHAWLVRIARALPARSTQAQVERALASLGSSGTCLSRCLAIAARAPRAEVVIAVRRAQDRDLAAHAWLELDGRALDPTHGAFTEIARLPGLPGRGTRPPPAA